MPSMVIMSRSAQEVNASSTGWHKLISIDRLCHRWANCPLFTIMWWYLLVFCIILASSSFIWSFGNEDHSWSSHTHLSNSSLTIFPKRILLLLLLPNFKSAKHWPLLFPPPLVPLFWPPHSIPFLLFWRTIPRNAILCHSFIISWIVYFFTSDGGWWHGPLGDRTKLRRERRTSGDTSKILSLTT